MLETAGKKLLQLLKPYMNSNSQVASTEDTSSKTDHLKEALQEVV